jgi:hypothetical protein
MPRALKANLVLLFAILSTACATAQHSDRRSAPKAPGVSPADLVASISEVASGRNPAMREAGLILKTVELKLLLGTEEKAGGKISVVVISAEAARRSEVSFSQTFILEIPASPKRAVASGPLVPGVREFVETAMEAARDIVRAAAAEGLPQRLKEIELVAKLERSRKTEGGIAFTLPSATPLSVGAGAERSLLEENTIKLLFTAAP